MERTGGWKVTDHLLANVVDAIEANRRAVYDASVHKFRVPPFKPQWRPSSTPKKAAGWAEIERRMG